MDTLEQKKYPLGIYQQPEKVTDEELTTYIDVLKNFPGKLKLLVENWDDDRLDTPYRELGWTVRQLVNHLSDSHMQSFGRFKMALTEDHPTVKPYDQAKWAELQDSRNGTIKFPLMILEGVHARWIHLLKTMTNKEFSRTYFHPEYDKTVMLRDNVAFYAWHCNHHLAHIDNLKKEKGWQ